MRRDPAPIATAGRPPEPARRRACARLGLRTALAASGAALGCSRPPAGTPPADATDDAQPSVDADSAAPARRGMVWVPPGALVAGTPPGRLPRAPDEEMPGEQVVLDGFFIDEFPFPNEAGAMPKTGASQQEAAALCADQGKRLCTELEWERACKGPDNGVFEYGDAYRPSECRPARAAGVPAGPLGLVPNGTRAGCRSAFGARDMHGGPWEWTSSPWRRGAPRAGAAFAVRGGTTVPGGASGALGVRAPSGAWAAEIAEAVARCANGRGIAPDAISPDVGFRCCDGAAGTVEVSLAVTRGKGFEPAPFDPRLAASLAATVPEDVGREMGAPARVDRIWTWRPVGNEDLLLASACAPSVARPACGVIVVRPTLTAHVFVGFAPSGWWAPEIKKDATARSLWVFGGDDKGTFRRRLAYLWGRVGLGDPEHKKRPVRDSFKVGDSPAEDRIE